MSISTRTVETQLKCDSCGKMPAVVGIYAISHVIAPGALLLCRRCAKQLNKQLAKQLAAGVTP